MYTIQTLNKIADCGIKKLDINKFKVSSDAANPDGVILRSFSMHEMELPSNLLGVARAGAGVNNIPIDKCSEKGVVVFNTPGANANAVKELVIAGLLLASRRIVDGINWAQSLQGKNGVAKLVEAGKADFVGPELLGKKIGIVGLGAIGVLVANACNALGMEVYGHDPYISVDAAWKLSRGVIKSTKEFIFENCDYISINVPFIKETENYINEELLRKTKKGVRIINIARGELVDNKAMIAAIEDGTVACYVTDFPNDEVLGIKNIITIPHLGASSPESEDNCAIMAADQLGDFLEYGNIVNSVNFPDCVLDFTGKKRICVTHKNIPNVVGPLTTCMAKSNINIENMINKSKGNLAYTMIDIDGEVNETLKNELTAVEGVISVRVI